MARRLMITFRIMTPTDDFDCILRTTVYGALPPFNSLESSPESGNSNTELGLMSLVKVFFYAARLSGNFISTTISS